jgi:hypothetical protein
LVAEQPEVIFAQSTPVTAALQRETHTIPIVFVAVSDPSILKRLEANGKHLLGLINNVLDLSKIEAGQLVLELSDYSLQDIAQTVRSTLEPLAADKKLAFKLEIGPDLPPGHGDGRRLTQVCATSAITPTARKSGHSGTSHLCQEATFRTAERPPRYFVRIGFAAAGELK